MAVIERDWTITDRACEEDDRRHREWWRKDQFAEPDYREGPEPDPQGEDEGVAG